MSSFVCAMHDPGGALALLPVLRLASAWQVRTYAGAPAQAMLRSQGLPFEPLPVDLSPAEAEAMLQVGAPRALLTGTSWGGNAEQALRNAAQRRGLPSVVLLDFWSNYRVRFQHAQTAPLDMPDEIQVMDDDTRREMIAEGFNPARLAVSGQPHLEALAALGPRTAPGQTNRLLFLSQPDLSSGRTVHQESLLRQLFQEANRLAEARGRRVELLFKPHPKETPPSIGQLRALCHVPRVDIVPVDRAVPLLELLEDVEAVAGGATMGLFEARARGVGATALNAATAPPALLAALRNAGIRVHAQPSFEGVFEHTQLEASAKLHSGAAARVLNAVTRSMR